MTLLTMTLLDVCTIYTSASLLWIAVTLFGTVFIGENEQTQTILTVFCLTVNLFIEQFVV